MLKINDIQETAELDRDAMKTVEGGIYRSAKSSYRFLQSADPEIFEKNELYRAIANTF